MKKFLIVLICFISLNGISQVVEFTINKLEYNETVIDYTNKNNVIILDLNRDLLKICMNEVKTYKIKTIEVSDSKTIEGIKVGPISMLTCHEEMNIEQNTVILFYRDSKNFIFSVVHLVSDSNNPGFVYHTTKVE